MVGFQTRLQLLLVAYFASTGAAVLIRNKRDAPKDLDEYTFNHFVQEYGREYEPGSEEWAMREGIFNERLQEVREWQAGPTRSWNKGVTRFMDYTQKEYEALLGYKGRGSRWSPRGNGAISLYRSRHEEDLLPLPAFINVGSNRTLGSLIRDQGACGSCWAEAATSALEGAVENSPQLFAALQKEAESIQKLPTLSSQAMVSCTANPRHCGGKGGCEGATAELGFSMVQQRGLPLAVHWPYESGAGVTPQCRDGVFRTMRLGISGYEVVPSNKLDALKRALVKSGGPIVVSVDATNWAYYSSGIFSDTTNGKKGDFTVNHAVTLMGFAEPADGQKGYWLIKNSWGGTWGESGFIRLEMKANEEEHCGWDYAAHEGSACDGDPDTAWVCGTCGILYDASYPTGAYLMHPDAN